MKPTIQINTPAVCGWGGWTRAGWIGQQNGRKATLYLIQLTGNGETFYKVGITYSFSSRFSRLNMPYQIRTIARYGCWDAGRVWDLEQGIHKAFSHLAYVPNLSFSGESECYAELGPLLAAMPKATFILRHVSALLEEKNNA